ncbi:unnamed protein product [Closterium sp. NIES-53]
MSRCRAALPSRAAEPPCRVALPCLAELLLLLLLLSLLCTAAAPTATMASPTILTFDAEGRAVGFDVWVDDLQLFLQCDSRDGVSLFDHTSGVSTAPAVTADSVVRSQWTNRDDVACLAVRSHLPLAERAHFGQYKTAQSLYDAVVARYSSPSTAALSRLMLPYLFPDLAAFAIVADLLAHLRTSDARYRAALPTEFCAKNPPPMYITLYYLVTRLRDSLSSVWDHFLSLCPTELTVSLLEERLTAAEKRILAVGASCGDRRTPFFEGCSPVPLLPSVASAAAVDLVGTDEVGVASAPSARRRNSKGKGGRVAAAKVVEAAAEVVEAAAEAGSGSGGGGGGGGGADFDAILAAMYALADITEGDFYLSVPPDLGTAAAALGAGTAAALGASASAAPGAGTAAALGASASAAPGAGTSTLSGTAPTEALHTITLDSGASRSLFRDSTMLTPLARPVAVSLARSSTVLSCRATPSGLLSGLHLPSFSTNLVSGADLQDAWVDQFNPRGSSLYTLTTAPPPVSASGQVAASSQVFAAALRSSPASAPYSCRRPLSHETLLWHHRLGHPSLPRLREFSSDLLRAFCHSEGIRQTLTLPASPKQNGIAERRIGMVVDVARTSMIHAEAPHFLWPFTVQYAAHQINLQPRVSLPETTPTLRWTGKVGDASAFRVWGSRACLCKGLINSGY